MNISAGIKTIKSVITANSPVLLVGTSIAGVVATGVLAAKAGYRARGIIDDATAEKGEELVLREKVELTWLCYAAPALTGVSTICATVGVHTIHTKRHAAMAGLYAVASNKLDDYQDKAEELLGPKKTQQLQNEVAQKSVDRSDFRNHEVLMLDGGSELCYDEWSGRYFMGSMNKIEDAVNQVNRLLIENDGVSLNEFYDFLGLTTVQAGEDVGWTGEPISAKFGATMSPDERPAITFWFRKSPSTRYLQR